MRKIENTEHEARCPWPEDVYIQGGKNGLVISTSGNYRTAFFEAFPGTFLRGEGATVHEAEQACWERFQLMRSCNHSAAGFERGTYTNGSGLCRGCGTWFPSQVTRFAELPE